jgi:CheY-like chemotaxis protein
MHQILLVEDNAADARLMSEALGDVKAAAALSWVTSGEEALGLLRRTKLAAGERRPDLVLLDLNLPGLNGHEVLSQIKGDPALRSTPVLVLSSSARSEDVLSAYDAHANAYLLKPQTYEGVLNLVTTIKNHWLGAVVLPTYAV